MILLGEALGDEELTAAGVMGYSFETRANVEYWFDPHDDVFPKTYAHNACGIIWCSSIVWGTWFTASPAWIYGNPVAALGSAPRLLRSATRVHQKTYADLERELASFEEKEAAKKPGSEKKPVGIKTLGGELGSYHLGFLMQADAPRVVAELDKLWAEPGDKVAHNEWMTNIYYQASALAELGRWTGRRTEPAPRPPCTRIPRPRRAHLSRGTPPQSLRRCSSFRVQKPLGKVDVAAHSIASAAEPY
jgi:hypothetical protein